MKYLSVCSGVEAATLAWEPLGWEPVAFSEIESFPCALLAHHYPYVPNWGDMTKFKEWPDAAIDVLVGGTPCQSFSVAGLRKGLDDPRGNLCLTYLAIADRYRPNWLVWENVPGVLSSAEGRDFGSFIGGLEQLGYHAAWRVLDAQFVRVDGLERAVPQRRRRVFVVGYLGDWRRAAAVLFERESLRWDNPPSRKTGQRIAPTVEARANAGGAGWGTDFLSDGGMAVENEAAFSLNHTSYADRGENANLVAPTMRAGGNETGGHRPPGTDVDTADSLIVSPTVTNKWHKGNGGPAGDECQNLVAIPYSIMPMNSSKDYKARVTDVAQPIMAAGPGMGDQGGDYIVEPQACYSTESRCDNLPPPGLSPPLKVGSSGGGQPPVVTHFQPRGSNVDTRQDVAATIGTNTGSAAGASVHRLPGQCRPRFHRGSGSLAAATIGRHRGHGQRGHRLQLQGCRQ